MFKLLATNVFYTCFDFYTKFYAQNFLFYWLTKNIWLDKANILAVRNAGIQLQEFRALCVVRILVACRVGMWPHLRVVSTRLFEWGCDREPGCAHIHDAWREPVEDDSLPPSVTSLLVRWLSNKGCLGVVDVREVPPVYGSRRKQARDNRSSISVASIETRPTHVGLSCSARWLWAKDS